MKNLLTIFSLTIILGLFGCSSKPDDVRQDFYEDSIVVAKTIDNAMNEQRYLTDGELKLHKNYLSNYANDNDIQKSTNTERDIQTAIRKLQTWQEAYIDLLNDKVKQSKADDKAKMLEIYNNDKQKLIKLLNIDEFTTD